MHGIDGDAQADHDERPPHAAPAAHHVVERRNQAHQQERLDDGEAVGDVGGRGTEKTEGVPERHGREKRFEDKRNQFDLSKCTFNVSEL